MHMINEECDLKPAPKCIYWNTDIKYNNRMEFVWLYNSVLMTNQESLVKMLTFAWYGIIVQCHA